MKLYFIASIAVAILLSACVSTNSRSNQTYLPEASELNEQLGLAYINEKDWLNAENKLMLAKQQNAQSVDVLNALAYVFQKTDRLDLARVYYEKAKRLQPNNPELLNHFGAFLCQQGNYLQGIAALQQASQQADFSMKQSIDENLSVCHLLAAVHA